MAQESISTGSNYLLLNHIRIQILDLHGLKPADFDNMTEALEAADKLVSVQRETISGVPQQHPDIIIGNAKLDQFWYANHKGIGM